MLRARVFLTRACLAALALLAAVPAANAQDVQRLDLVLQPATLAAPVPANGTPLPFDLTWRIQCRQPAPAPEAALPPAAVHLSVDGSDFKLGAADGTVTFPDCATVQATTGTWHPTLVASPGVPGEVPLQFALHAQTAGVGPAPGLAAKIELQATVGWSGHLEARTPITKAAAGPQKTLLFPIGLTWSGNAPATLLFAVKGPLPPGWSPVPPAPVVARPGEPVTVNFLVLTPHHDGPNDNSTDLELLVRATSTRDATANGPVTNLTFTPRVEGLYIPAPSAAVSMVALAAAITVRRATRRP